MKKYGSLFVAFISESFFIPSERVDIIIKSEENPNAQIVQQLPKKGDLYVGKRVDGVIIEQNGQFILEL